jgi:hypothetical protein
VSFASFKLGKQAARFDPRTLRLAKYLTPGFTVPRQVNNYSKVQAVGMLGNNAVGDCVEAGQLHMVQQWTADAGTEIVPTTADAIALYREEAGYVPGEPDTDVGTDALSALKYWRKTGILIGGDIHKIGAFVQISGWWELQASIFLFGNAAIGLQLPLTAQDQSGSWFVVPDAGQNAQPGSWGGHFVPGVGYTLKDIIPVFSWGQIIWMKRGFFETYADEVYAVLSTDWLEKTGDAPNGFDLAQLQSDLAAITA